MPAEKAKRSGSSPIRITRINAYQVDLPVAEGRYSWSNDNFVEVFDSTIIEIETDAGIKGYGECCPLGPSYLPAYAAGVRAGLKELGPKLTAIAQGRGGSDEPVFVRGDRTVEYGHVARVMARLRESGFRKISLVTEVEGGG